MGSPWSPRSFARRFFIQRWAEPKDSGGCPGHRLHLFRHTAGSLLEKKTGDIKRVQEQLGHADIGTTADIYTDIDLETVRQNAADLESVFLEACGGYKTVFEER
jgi:integrase